MEQHINNVYGGQVAAKDIYNFFINNEFNISNLTLQELFDVVYNVKSENRKIIRLKYPNIPSVAFFLIIVFLLFINIFSVNIFLTSDISNIHVFSNILFITATISLFSIPILSLLLFSRTKYLHQIIVKNNKINLEFELETPRRELRGEN